MARVPDVIGALLCGAGIAAGALAMARPRPLPPPCSSTSSPGRHGDGVIGVVSVIVPARNEAATLPALLRSLRLAGPLVREVIVVDDNSTDATATVAAEHGATVLRLDSEPPPGWTGKNHACARGAAIASAPQLLFLDADVVLSDTAMTRLLCAHAAHGGLVSVQPFHTVRDAYEELSAGCNIVSMMGSGAFAAWRSRVRPAAFGPCLMTSADDYARAGGHASVRGDVVEDISLARRYAECGLSARVFMGGDAVSFRMYPRGLRQLVEGWTKNLATGSRSAQPIAVVAAASWLTACLAIGVNGIAALIRIRVLSPADALVAALAWLLVACHTRWMLGRIGGFRALTALVHPVPLWAFVALFGRSTWHTTVHRSVRWKGRPIDLEHRRAS